MKSLRWIIPLFVVMGGAFAIYLWTQPASSVVRRPASTSPARQPSGPTTALAHGQTAGPGEDVWAKTYDQKTGELSSQFKADKFAPRPDNTVDVTAPVAEFFQNDGRVLRIRGTHGRVVLPGEAGRSNDFRSQGGPPTRGDLFNVVIELLDSADAQTAAVRCDVPNVRFDNDTFSIATESYRDEAGNDVPADRVPVVVTGDYEFKGQGLLIRWNERDRRLALLEIAHGDTLTIRDPSKLGRSDKPATRPSADADADADSDADPFAGVALADADDESAKAAVRSAAPKKPAKESKPAPAAKTVERDRSPVSYRATFFDDVRVFQADVQIAASDVMHVDFTEGDDKGGKGSAARPTDAEPADRQSAGPASTRPAATRPTTRRAATRPTTRGAATLALTPAPAATTRAAAPTTLPAEPITIKWTGKLRVTPPPADVERVGPGEMAVEMSSPDKVVWLAREGSDIRCGSFRYRSGDDSLVVNKSAAVPVVSMTEAGGAKLITDGIAYEGRNKRAKLLGAGRAEVPLASHNPAPNGEPPNRDARPEVPPPATAPAGRMLASWSKGCTLFLTGETRETLSFDRATLEGDVVVDHPQMRLTSGKLDLDLARQTKAGEGEKGPGVTLRKLDAADDVHCTLTADDGGTQSVTAQRLTLETAADADGRLAPRKLVADGAVHARGGENELSGGRLEVLLAPVASPTTRSATRPADADAFEAVEVESIFAQGNVVFAGVDGGRAAAEHVFVAMNDGKPAVDLWGQPASVGDRTDTIAGPHIKIAPAKGVAEVLGAGTLTSHRVGLYSADDPAATPASGGPVTRPATTRPAATRPATTRPVVVAWQGSLRLDGPANRVDVLGGVTISSTQDDGATNVAAGKRLTIVLRNKPTTRPADTSADRPAGDMTTKPSRAVAGLGGIDAGAFGNKDVVTASLEEGVDIDSTLKGLDGSVLRRMHMAAPLVRYEADARRMVVPAPGQLLFQDEQRAATRPSAQPVDGGTQFSGLGEFKGATAFGWQQQLSYDEATRRVRMSGDVLIIHQDVVGVSERLEIRAGEVIADLEPAGKGSATRPADPGNADAGTAGSGSAAGAVGGLGSAAKLKSLRAVAGVWVNAPKLQFSGDRIHFDPANESLVATGSDAFPVTLYDERGASKGTFGELRYNTRTQQMSLKGLRAGVQR